MAGWFCKAGGAAVHDLVTKDTAASRAFLSSLDASQRQDAEFIRVTVRKLESPGGRTEEAMRRAAKLWADHAERWLLMRLGHLEELVDNKGDAPWAEDDESGARAWAMASREVRSVPADWTTVETCKNEAFRVARQLAVFALPKFLDDWRGDDPRLNELKENRPTSAEDWMAIVADLELDVSLVVADAAVPGLPTIFANDAFKDMTGYANVVGKNLRILQGAKTERDSVDILRRALRSGKRVIVALTNYKRDGTRFKNLMTLCPVFDIEGNYRYVVGAQVELSARTTAQKRSVALALARLGRLVKQLPHKLQLPSSDHAARKLMLKGCLSDDFNDDDDDDSDTESPDEVFAARRAEAVEPDYDGPEDDVEAINVWVTRCAWLVQWNSPEPPVTPLPDVPILRSATGVARVLSAVVDCIQAAAKIEHRVAARRRDEMRASRGVAGGVLGTLFGFNGAASANDAPPAEGEEEDDEDDVPLNEALQNFDDTTLGFLVLSCPYLKKTVEFPIDADKLALMIMKPNATREDALKFEMDALERRCVAALVDLVVLPALREPEDFVGQVRDAELAVEGFPEWKLRTARCEDEPNEDSLWADRYFPALGDALSAYGNVGLVAVDARAPGGAIIQASDGFTRLVKRPRATMVGRNCRFLQVDGLDEPEVDDLSRAVRHDRLVSTKITNCDGFGEHFQCLVFLVPIRNGDERAYTLGLQFRLETAQTLGRHAFGADLLLRHLPLSTTEPPTQHAEQLPRDLAAWLALDDIAVFDDAEDDDAQRTTELCEALLKDRETRSLVIETSRDRSSPIAHFFLRFVLEVDSLKTSQDEASGARLLEAYLARRKDNPLLYCSPVHTEEELAAWRDGLFPYVARMVIPTVLARVHEAYHAARIRRPTCASREDLFFVRKSTPQTWAVAMEDAPLAIALLVQSTGAVVAQNAQARDLLVNFATSLPIAVTEAVSEAVTLCAILDIEDAPRICLVQPLPDDVGLSAVVVCASATDIRLAARLVAVWDTPRTAHLDFLDEQGRDILGDVGALGDAHAFDLTSFAVERPRPPPTRPSRTAFRGTTTPSPHQAPTPAPKEETREATQVRKRTQRADRRLEHLISKFERRHKLLPAVFGGVST